MAIPIPPSPPPSGPIPSGNNIGGMTPSFRPIDVFETSTSAALVAPAPEAGNPHLSIADYYGSISDANIGQKIQEFLDALNDPTFRKLLMQFVAEQASYMSTMITLVYQYDIYNKQLAGMDFDKKADKINDELADYGGVVGDNAQIATLNAASGTYNDAQLTYRNALTNYQTALNIFETAQTTYDTALEAWNTALANYQGGSISGAELEAARSIFISAENQFENGSKVAFNTAQSSFNAAKTAWQTAITTYTAAVSTYNAYAATRVTALNELNAAIDAWNVAYGSVAAIITKMNTIRSELGLPPFISTGTITNMVGLSTVVVPTGPSTFRNEVQADVDQDNALVAALNAIIGTVSGRAATINSGGYTPALTSPLAQSLLLSLPTTDSNTGAAFLANLTIPGHVTITLPPKEDLVATYLLPRLAILESLQEKADQETVYRQDVTDEKQKNVFSGRFMVGGGSGTGGVTSAKTIEAATSPFLGAILSKQAFEAFFNTLGVPQGSALVDQIGALYTRIQANAGLASAGPAHAILNNATLSGTAGRNALDTSIALGNLSVVNEIGGSQELINAIKSLISNDPGLAKLTPEQKNALLEGIAGEIGASLNKSALNELARALGLPGLVPQILALLAGLTEKDPLAPFSSQLYRTVLFAQELAKIFQISEAEAHAYIEAALVQQSKQAGSPTLVQEDPLQEQAAIENSIKEQLIKTGLVRLEVEQKVIQASVAADNRLAFEQQKSELVKTTAFRESLIKSFALLELDPVQADLLAAQIPIGPINEVTKLLIAKGLSLEEANQVATNALDAVNLKDALKNPLSSFLAQTYGNSTELAGLLKGQIVNILSPAVGMRTALHVAENYGSLIFSSANSITNVLTANERRLDAISYAIYDARLYENYRVATDSYISPELAPDSPLKLGKTLLLSGVPGGLSNQGLTSSDNTVGPSASQSKHTTSYPGIFG